MVTRWSSSTASRRLADQQPVWVKTLDAAARLPGADAAGAGHLGSQEAAKQRLAHLPCSRGGGGVGTGAAARDASCNCANKVESLDLTRTDEPNLLGDALWRCCRRRRCCILRAAGCDARPLLSLVGCWSCRWGEEGAIAW